MAITLENHFTINQVGNTAVYKDEHYRILEVNEEEQLLLINEIWTSKPGFWVRTENVSYIPF